MNMSFEDLNADMSRKAKMKPVVKYCVYSDILLRVPIYVTKYTCVCYEKHVNHKICQIAIRRPAGGSGVQRDGGCFAKYGVLNTPGSALIGPRHQKAPKGVQSPSKGCPQVTKCHPKRPRSHDFGRVSYVG